MRQSTWKILGRYVSLGLAVVAVAAAGAPALAAPPRHYPRGGGMGGARNFEQGEFRLWVGMFTPRGSSDLWQGNEEVFTGNIDDFRDVTGGGDILWSLNQNLSLGLSLSTYEGNTRQFYKEAFISDLGHTTRLNVTPLTLEFVFYPAGRNAPVVPYIGVGGGLYWWKYREAGDFCQFNDVGDCTPISTAFEDNGVAGGGFVMAGLDFPVRPNWSIFAEGRWQSAKGNLKGDFEGTASKIDLSGYTLAAGFAWKF